MTTLQTILLAILVFFELMRLVILILSARKNKAIDEQNNNLMRVYQKLEYWLDREDEREDV